MDLSKHNLEKEGDAGSDRRYPTNLFRAPTVNNPPSSSTSISSQSSRNSRLGTATHDHSPSPDMDNSDGYIRRRPLTMDIEETRDSSSKRKKPRPRSSQRKERQQLMEGESKHPLGVDDGHSSDYSTPSTSEEVENQDLTSEDGLTDDEETGLTKKDRLKRKRRKRLNTHLDERVAASDKTTNSGWSLADKAVIKASFINALLIALWYLFSVSISVVRYKKHL